MKLRLPRLTKSAPGKRDTGMLLRMATIGSFLLAAAGIAFGVLFVLATLEGAFTTPTKAYDTASDADAALNPAVLDRIRAARSEKTAEHAAVPADIRDPFKAPAPEPAPAPTPEPTPTPSDQPAPAAE
jgi:hypothetical protein